MCSIHLHVRRERHAGDEEGDVEQIAAKNCKRCVAAEESERMQNHRSRRILLLLFLVGEGMLGELSYLTLSKFV